MADGGRPAAFLDRDGTLIEDPGYLHEPGRVRLLPGAAAAVRRLNEAGYLAVTVTNQSGIARGLYDVAEYQAVQRRVVELLLAHGARLDGSWYCPHHPAFTGPCDCRKPGTRLFREAATELGIDFTRSFWVGDRLSDVGPARVLGASPARGIMVLTGEGGRHREQAAVLGVRVVADVSGAVDAMLGLTA